MWTNRDILGHRVVIFGVEKCLKCHFNRVDVSTGKYNNNFRLMDFVSSTNIMQQESACHGMIMNNYCTQTNTQLFLTVKSPKCLDDIQALTPHFTMSKSSAVNPMRRILLNPNSVSSGSTLRSIGNPDMVRDRG